MDALIHINKLFSIAVYASYNTKRYGIKSCNNTLDAELVDDLRIMYTRALEMKSCEACNTGCSLSVLEEKIKTL